MQNRVTTSQAGTVARRLAAVLLFFMIAASCSRATRELFFDIQAQPASAEKAPESTAPAESATPEVPAQPTDPRALAPDSANPELPRPAIESVDTWEQAQAMLPKDSRKGADWVAALEQGIVRPRTGADPKTALAAIFKYDFIIETEDPKNDAYFPHSAHTQWLGCENCHTALFARRRNPATMKDMMKGASCGYCHGRKSVAFELRNCSRCHPNR